MADPSALECIHDRIRELEQRLEIAGRVERINTALSLLPQSDLLASPPIGLLRLDPASSRTLERAEHFRSLGLVCPPGELTLRSCILEPYEFAPISLTHSEVRDPGRSVVLRLERVEGTVLEAWPSHLWLRLSPGTLPPVTGVDVNGVGVTCPDAFQLLDPRLSVNNLTRRYLQALCDELLVVPVPRMPFCRTLDLTVEFSELLPRGTPGEQVSADLNVIPVVNSETAIYPHPMGVAQRVLKDLPEYLHPLDPSHVSDAWRVSSVESVSVVGAHGCTLPPCSRTGYTIGAIPHPDCLERRESSVRFVPAVALSPAAAEAARAPNSHIVIQYDLTVAEAGNGVETGAKFRSLPPIPGGRNQPIDAELVFGTIGGTRGLIDASDETNILGLAAHREARSIEDALRFMQHFFGDSLAVPDPGDFLHREIHDRRVSQRALNVIALARLRCDAEKRVAMRVCEDHLNAFLGVRDALRYRVRECTK